nr:prolactin receptor b [Misgurnus anguillicaudatus]
MFSAFWVVNPGKMRRDADALTLMWLLYWISYSMCHSPPGRPRLTKCRSPEKETFTCWWEPGSSGGLPTSHHLYYRKESSVEVFECPDYHKAGNNSCFFDKQHTSIWIIYNITVLASNALGKTYSESVEVDVMDIVQPHPPENVNVTVNQTENSFYVLLRWRPPSDADTRSGWVTIKYEVRIKMENSKEKKDWESYSAGKQLEFSIYSPQPGASYHIQVRCKLDHGMWSEWSSPVSIWIPDKTSETQNDVMIFAASLTAFIFLLSAALLAAKIKHVKHFLLPPIPEPKINGFDTQLIKNATSGEIFDALIIHGYPQIAQGSERDVEYLVISEDDEETFDGKCFTEPAQKFKQIGQKSTEELKRLSCPGPGRDPQDYRYEYEDTLATIQPEISSEHLQLDGSGQLQLDRSGLPINAQDRNPAKYTCLSSDRPRKLSISPGELTGYVEVDKEKREQEPLEDYSKISDILSDNVLVLHKDTNVQRHKEIKCDKTFETEISTGSTEPLEYLETVTTFSS